jgi:hypothetical protein
MLVTLAHAWVEETGDRRQEKRICWWSYYYSLLLVLTTTLLLRQEKKLLVELFQTCGKVELDFVIRSGLYLGFLLGILQMFVWVCW